MTEAAQQTAPGRSSKFLTPHNVPLRAAESVRALGRQGFTAHREKTATKNLCGARWTIRFTGHHVVIFESAEKPLSDMELSKALENVLSMAPRKALK